MIKVAVLVDGGFYRKLAKSHCGKKEPEERAKELVWYCMQHVGSDKYLYRIFYYDCPPLDKIVYHPLTKRQVDLKADPMYDWTMRFFNELVRKRKLALRLGKREETSTCYTLTDKAIKRLIDRRISVDELTEEDFCINVGQKCVDSKIALDISSLSYKRQVDQIILISGDSDFVPAAKHARREGIDFILDPMGRKVNADLFEHIDGLQSFWHKLHPSK